VRQVLRLAPADARVRRTVQRLAADLEELAGHQGEQAVALTAAFTGARVPPPPAATRPRLSAQRRRQVVKRRRWRRPADQAYSEAGRARLLSLRRRHPSVEEAWSWLDGRRDVGQVWERLQFGAPVTGRAVADYLDLLVAEDFACRVAHV